MSIEAKIEALTAAIEKNTAQQGELIAVLTKNTDTMGVMIDGRQEALEALTSKDAEPKKPAKKAAAKKAKEEPAAEEPAAEEPKEEPKTKAKADAWDPDLSAEGIRNHFVPYISGATGDEKQKRVDQLAGILAELGADTINPTEGKTHLESDDDRRKAVFYITRYANGLPVDFKADYDFNADPLTQATEPAASDDDLVG